METTLIRGKKFFRLGRRMFGKYDISGISIQDCVFENCSFGYNNVPLAQKRDSVKDMQLLNCKVSKCILGPAEIRSTQVHNLSGDMLICWGTLFDQVVLEGEIQRLMLHGIPESRPSAAIRSSHEKRSKEFYSRVQWALDISQAQFDDFSIRNGAVPLSLIRRDINCQFIISGLSGSDLRGEIAALPLSDYSKAVLSTTIDENVNEVLLVAPQLDKPLYNQVLRDAEALARIGVLS
ncbi:hypothetical protein [Massilia rhizosphaerae]|uniref:hypothetical protein n=1 Tax=Massilia rhizosphaerae TaxID=2784389 RepID=UPI0018DCE40C|nr:hypothetical protein [Massilia rhizosphaerae]